ncbi:HAD-IA family hydrolase [Streptomyces sp. NPDC001493]
MKAAVIGGSTGVGRGVADAWAAEGIETHVFSRSRPDGPGADRLVWHRLDFRDPEQAKQALRTHLPTDVSLVCYSAIYFTARREPFLETGETDWLDQFAINVHGLAWTLRAALPLLRSAAPGLFLHISSEVVYNAGPNRSGYAATKAAASSLIRSVSQETDPEEVTFVEALPAGMVDSPGIRARRSPEFDYSGYMPPDAFAPLAVELARTRGVPYTGDALVVHDDTTWSSVASDLPVSQSRALNGSLRQSGTNMAVARSAAPGISSPRLRASVLLFDMDGTLVDSTALVESTWAGFSARHRTDLTEVLAYAHGRPTRETVAHFVADPELAASETRRLVAHEQSETTGITEVPGAGEFLATLPPGTWGIVTSADRKLAEVRLAAAGLPLPEVLVSADDVARGKPHPEGYLRAAALFGVEPSDTIVFEDSGAGVRAGLASGARTVVIGGLDEYDGVAERYADFRGFHVTPERAAAGGVSVAAPEPVAGRAGEPR